MRTYLRFDFERFLAAVDAALEGPARLGVIGGSAASLRFGISQATRDIDTWTEIDGALATAIKEAHRIHDIQAIAEIHASSPLDLATLVERFRHEMTHVVGDPQRIQDKFLALVERLFPDSVSSVARGLARQGRGSGGA